MAGGDKAFAFAIAIEVDGLGEGLEYSCGNGLLFSGSFLWVFLSVFLLLLLLLSLLFGLLFLAVGSFS